MDAPGAWYVVGPLLGLLIIAMLWTVNRPLGALGGYVDLYEWLRRPTGAPGWRAFFLAGVVLGGFGFVLATGGPRSTFDYDLGATTSPAARGLLLVVAGILIGYGARRAGGCTSGHGLCGSALASPASWVATGTFMATAIASQHVLAWALGGTA